MKPLYNPSCRIDNLNAAYDFRATVDVLRLDQLHPIVSGNKWFKLQHYLREARAAQKAVLTFGGAYSNHLVATAAAAAYEGLPCIGVVRGEKPPVLSPTLDEAQRLGMRLYFSSRLAYKNKEIPADVGNEFAVPELYLIPEGGYGAKGAKGAKEILRRNNTRSYTHVLCAVGTGTTLAGLVAGAVPAQHLLGISVLKNNLSLQPAIEALLPPGKKAAFELLHDFHFGGYAKHTPELIRFMNELYGKTGLPTDFVYTAKTFYAAFHLLRNGFFSVSDRVLIIHTGGLQGNRSLPKGTLIFG